MILHHDAISSPLENPRLRVLSLGGGVQSCALALMSARGDVPLLDAAIFADTGDEKRATYRYLDWLEAQLPFPLIRSRRGGPTLGEQAVAVAEDALPYAGHATPPYYLADPDGMAPKYCNADFKRDVVTRAIRDLMARGGVRLERGRPLVEQWIGFTTDELRRLAPARKKFLHNRWPLIEARMSRPACIHWFETRQLPVPPKSSCVYCPYQGNAEWRAMRDNSDDDDWSRAVTFDAAIRPYHAQATGTAYVHRSCKPLHQAPIDATDLGEMFRFECEGMCGV